jgi:hypothetical protein
VSSPFNIFMKTFDVHRKDAGGYINGKWIEGAETIFNIQADLQPLQPNEMQSLPEGRRIDDAQTFFTDTFLRATDGNNKNPDIIIIEGERYEIIKIYDWDGRLKHYKVLAMRVEQEL